MCAPSQCSATPNASLNATSSAKNSTYAANDDGSGTRPRMPASSLMFPNHPPPPPAAAGVASSINPESKSPELFDGNSVL